MSPAFKAAQEYCLKHGLPSTLGATGESPEDDPSSDAASFMAGVEWFVTVELPKILTEANKIRDEREK